MRLPLAMAALGAGSAAFRPGGRCRTCPSRSPSPCAGPLSWSGLDSLSLATHSHRHNRTHRQRLSPWHGPYLPWPSCRSGCGSSHCSRPRRPQSTLPLPAIAVASLLDLGVAIGAAVLLRSRPAARRQSAHGEGFTVPLVIGAFAMTAIVLPALGSTAAGSAASAGSHATHQQSELLRAARRPHRSRRPLKSVSAARTALSGPRVLPPDSAQEAARQRAGSAPRRA